MSGNDYYGGNGQGYHQPQPQYPPQGNYPPQPNYAPSPGNQSPYPQPPNYANTPPQQGYGPPAHYAPQGQSYQPNYGPSPSHSPAPYQHNAPPYPNSHSPVPQPQYNSGGYANDERSNPNGPPGSDFDPAGPVGPDGERGLGATLLGGSAGGFLAHKAGGGGLVSVLGAVAGAIGANALENQHKKKKEHRNDNNLAYGNSSYAGSNSAVGGLYPGYGQSQYAGSDSGSHHSHHHHGHHKHHRHSSRSRSRSRGIDDESD